MLQAKPSSAKGGGKDDEPEARSGAFAIAGVRKERTAEKVAARMQRWNKLPPAPPTGVVPLNPGFFALEAVRQLSSQARKRLHKKAKVKSR